MINNVQIEPIEALLLPKNCHFADDARAVINCWDDANVLACPGSGKTTVLLAKLKILADRMPLAGGRGICILSHTNVAVDEIKKRLKGDSEKILSYPNFAGTIQSFVDTFVVFPFWRSFVKVSLRVVSSSEYAYRSWQLMQNGYQYSSLKGFVSRHCGVNTANETPIKVIEKLSLDNDGSLLISGKKQAGADSKSAQQLKSLNTYLHKNEGLMTYENAFRCASNILKKQGDSFRTLVSKRFKYVFIDEYQDCSNLQCSVLKDLFGGTDAVVQRIGDMDQAIYNSIYDSTNSSWDVSRDCLEISETNRFGNEIASVLSSLRTGHKTIVSARGFFRIKPVLFVYSSGAETKVVDAFVEEIRQTKLAKDGVYKAIGMLRKGSGMTITRYWNHFDKDAVVRSKDGLDFYLQEIVRHLHDGRLYKAEKAVVDFIVCFSRCCNIRTTNNRMYTKTTMCRKIEERCDKRFRECMLNLAMSFSSWTTSVEAQLLTLLHGICNEIFDRKWTEDEFANVISDRKDFESQRVALDKHYDDGITVKLDTVHGVKGETHDATLYLETEHVRSSDLRRIMPLFECGKLKDNAPIYEKSRRCAYVGLSRPRYLLCVAMQERTYEGHAATFEKDWRVVHVK